MEFARIQSHLPHLHYQTPIIREALTALLRNILNTDFNIDFCVVINRVHASSSRTLPYRIREYRTSIDLSNLHLELD